MVLKIKNKEVEGLLAEIVSLTGESEAEAVRKAVEERHRRLTRPGGRARDERRLQAFLEDEVWSQIPAEKLGTRLTKAEEENILGFGEDRDA